MTVISKAAAKLLFETGDKPTQNDFRDLIDSYQDFSSFLLAYSTAATGMFEKTSADGGTARPIGTLGQFILSYATTASVVGNLNLVVGTDVQADLAVPSQAEAEAGTATNERVWTAERVKQSIASLETAASGLVQIVNVQNGTTSTGTTTFPNDDTIPVKTEGDEYMTLAITPTNANNILTITAVVALEGSAATNQIFSVGLFQDATTNALAAVGQAESSATTELAQNIVLIHRMTAATTSSTTFRIRAGLSASGTTTFNGDNYGGITVSSITIMETTA